MSWEEQEPVRDTSNTDFLVENIFRDFHIFNSIYESIALLLLNITFLSLAPGRFQT